MSRTDMEMKDALKRLNVFREFMEEEDFGDTLDKIKAQVERLKREQSSAA